MRRLAGILIAVLLVAACGDDVSIREPAPTVPTSAPAPSTTTTTTTVAPSSTSVAPPSTTSTTLAAWSPPTTEAPWQTTVLCFAEPPPSYGPNGYEFDDGFYTHWCSASGIPVIGSARVPIESLEAGAQVVNAVIGYDQVNTEETIANGGLVILYGPGETAADLPEWEYVEGQTGHVSDDHPGFTASGGGITFAVVVWDDPVCAVPDDRHDAYGTADWGSVLVHELGHVVAGPTTRTRLVDFLADHVTSAYEAALAGNAWHDRHYAMTNPSEYWAEATQVYFGQYSSSSGGLRHPRTRQELAEQDPLITTLLQTVYGDTTGIGRYWCEVYGGPTILLPDESAGYAPVE